VFGCIIKNICRSLCRHSLKNFAVYKKDYIKIFISKSPPKKNMKFNKTFYSSIFIPGKILLPVFLLMFFISTAYSQNDNVWKGKKCAVSLTYDDALNVHLDNVVPLLDSLGLKATFYISGYYPGFRERLNEWKIVAGKGNELGNHTLFHPCEGNAPGREWVKPDYDLNNYSMQRLLDEIRVTNELLSAVDEKHVRTFAYTCGDKKVGDSSFVPEIKDDFIAARSVEEKMQQINEIDLFNISSYPIIEKSGEELISLVKEAKEKNALIVFLFHGVGGEHSLNVSLDAHSKLLHYLKENEEDIWIAPMVDIAGYIKEHNQQAK
jgi:sialate O-acetylesterase